MTGLQSLQVIENLEIAHASEGSSRGSFVDPKFPRHGGKPYNAVKIF
jgi:hypothetical protein